MKRRRLTSRFVPSRRDRRRAAWFPVALRWRQPRPRLHATRIHRAATPLTLQAAWLAHFHLHFASPPRERSRHAESGRLASVTTMYRMQRIAVTAHSTSVRNIAHGTHLHRSYGGPMAVHHATRNTSALTLFRQTSLSATRSVFMAGPRMSGVPGGVHHTTWNISPVTVFRRTSRFATRSMIMAGPRVYGGPVTVHHATRNISPVTIFRQTSRIAARSVIVGARSTLSTVVRKDVRTETVRHERARSVERVHRRELHASRLLSSTRTELVKRLLQETVTSPQTIIRPAVIVWRRESQTGAENGDDSSRAERDVSSSRSVPLESIGRSMRPAAALQAARLDMDRLTDDVIRRVERRMRIERERRGL